MVGPMYTPAGMPSPGRRGIGGAEEAADQVPAAVDAHLVEHDFEVVLHGVPGEASAMLLVGCPRRTRVATCASRGVRPCATSRRGAVSRASMGSTMTVILASRVIRGGGRRGLSTIARTRFGPGRWVERAGPRCRSRSL